MKAIKFKGHNMVLAEDQPQYTPLPVCCECTSDGSMVSCFALSFWERMRVLFTGRMFFRQLTFGNPLQPIRPMVEWEEGNCNNCGKPIGDHKYKKAFTCPDRVN